MATEIDVSGHFRMAERFKMLSEPTRVEVLLILSDGPRNVSQIHADLGGAMTQQGLTHHLVKLRISGFVEDRRVGKFNVQSLTERGEAMAAAIKGIANGRA